MRKPYELYSVESRKGGVGKTTMALSLARLLSKKEYSVLLIDCDITGTSVTTAASHSSVWREDVNPLKFDGNDINLLDFFKNEYLNGKADGRTICDKSILDSSLINVIGSEIYGEDNGVIISPSVLTDELHSFWFVSMLKELADSFSEKQPEDRNVAIIIDNSPGYVGIGHAIHEWLGELGPSRAKCLMVSSLDEQDLQSCEGATRELENTITRYSNAVQYYQDVKKGIDPTVDYKSFKDSKAESFFYELVDKNGKGRSEADLLSVEKYVALVLNKIPTEYANADTIKAMLNSFDESKIERVMIACQNGNNIIEENPFLSQQFYVNRIEHKRAISSLQNKWNGYEKTIIKAYNDWNQIGPYPQFLNKMVSNLDDAIEVLPVGDVDFLRSKQLSWLQDGVRDQLFKDQPLINVLFDSFSLAKMKDTAEEQLNIFNGMVEDIKEEWPESKFLKAAHDYLVKPCSTSTRLGFAQRIVAAITFSILLNEYVERLRNGDFREGNYIYEDRTIDGIADMYRIIQNPKLRSRDCQNICLANSNGVLNFMNRLLPRLTELGHEIDLWITILEIQFKNPMVSVLTPEMREYLHKRFDLCSSELDYSKAIGSVRHEYEIYNTELTLQDYVLKQWGL